MLTMLQHFLARLYHAHLSFLQYENPLGAPRLIGHISISSFVMHTSPPFNTVVQLYLNVMLPAGQFAYTLKNKPLQVGV